MTSPLLKPNSWDNEIRYRTDLSAWDKNTIDGIVLRVSGGPDALTNAQADKVELAASIWEMYVDVSFVPVTDAIPEVVIRSATSVEARDNSSDPWEVVNGAVRDRVNLAGDETLYSDVILEQASFIGDLRSDNFNTIVHELGHVLGLRDGAVLGTPYTDRTNTIMAYTGDLPTTPMIYDIQALHERYGESDYNSGETDYGRSKIDGTDDLWTLWDASGIDTIDFSWAGKLVEGYIDLRGGVNESGNARLSQIGDNRFAIAFDVIDNTSGSGVVDIENVTGGAGDDVVLGGYVGNTLRGMAGDDTLVGYSGGDLIMGGDGNDWIVDLWVNSLMGTRPTNIVADNDVLFGDKGNDTIEGQDGNNLIVGGEGDDRLYMGDDATGRALGGAGGDEIFANASGVMLVGSDDINESDVIYGGQGNDTLYGGATDFVIGDWDSAVEGNDLLYVSGINGQSGTVDDPNYVNMGFAEGNGGDDTIIASDSWIDAGEGDDLVVIDKGVAEVYLGGGDNTLIVNPGAKVNWYDFDYSSSATLQLGNQVITGEFLSKGIRDYNTVVLTESVHHIGGDYVMRNAEAAPNSSYGVYQIFKLLNPNDPVNNRVKDPDGAEITIFYDGDGYPDNVEFLYDIPKLGISAQLDGNGNWPEGGPKYTSITKYVHNALADPSASTPESKSGTSASDYIQSGSGADTVGAGAGDDVVRSRAGADSVSAGDGDDFIQSDDLEDTVGGADTVSGGNGNDFVQTGSGDDSVDAGAGRDIVEGGSGADVLRGYGDADRLSGESGVDSLYGGDGADFIDGGAGADYLYGQAGADVFVVGTVAHSLLAGGNYDRIADFENDVDKIDLQATAFYTLTSNSATQNGQLRMYLSSDGTRTFIKSDQSDFFLSITGNHLADLSDDDFVFGGTPPEYLYGTTGNDTLTDGALSLRMYGIGGNDTLSGGEGDDVLDGGVGVDRLSGGTGADVFRFSAQTHSYGAGSQFDRITDFENGVDKIDLTGLGFTTLTSTTTVAGELRLSYSSTSDRTYVKSDQVDFNFYLDGDRRGDLDNSDFIFGPLTRIDGTSSANALTGTSASEGIFGMEGNDTLSGGTGQDTLDGGAGVDRLTGGTGADIFKFTDLTHSVSASSQYDRITDFENGVDKIDLSGLGFTTLTTAGSTQAGEIRLTYSSGSDRTYVRTDQSDFWFYFDGNRTADLDNSDFIFG